LGIVIVLGQILFVILIVPLLEFSSKKRKNEIISQYSLDVSPINPEKLIQVDSVNLETTIQKLTDINPSVVIINGTRIVSKNVLNSLDAKFVNIHAGITSQYRGVHGGYWALVEGYSDLCGVTIHLVDPGIDSGSVLEQSIISTLQNDNYTTYPLIQLGSGLPLLLKTVNNLLEGELNLKSVSDSQSKLWSHPTILQYIWNRLVRGIK